MSNLICRRIFYDIQSIKDILSGKKIRTSNLLQRIFTMERSDDHELPDHFFKKYMDQRLDAVISKKSQWSQDEDLGDMVNIALNSGAKYLARSHGRICVKKELFSQWQHTLPFISPLSSIIQQLRHEPLRPHPYAFKEIHDEVSRSLRASALLSPPLLSLNDMINSEGLYETHMHLTGSTELDNIWPDAVAKPRVFYRNLVKQMKYEGGGGLGELYAQIDSELTPLFIYKALKSANRARRMMAYIIKSHIDGFHMDVPYDVFRYLLTADISDIEATEIWSEKFIKNYNGYRDALRGDRNKARQEKDHGDQEIDDLSPYITPFSEAKTKHPVEIIAPGFQCDWARPLAAEGVWIWSCLDALDYIPENRRCLSLGLYLNFLVCILIGRLSVQQINQSGFDQFQKITWTGARNEIESAFHQRFEQLCGSEQGDLTHLEGRFAPAETIQNQIKIFKGILNGYLRYRYPGFAGGGAVMTNPSWLTGRQPPQNDLTGPLRQDRATALDQPYSSNDAPRQDRRTQLGLVGHFIKAPDDSSLRIGHDDADIAAVRHRKLRKNLIRKGRTLIRSLQLLPAPRSIFHGIDAAANELHAGPEVFAPIYRYMRRHGIPHATFHAGEDFIHIVSGIRAVWEAAQFLNLRNSDRIGHATAIGLCPTLFLKPRREAVMMNIEDALDDAVFAHSILHRDSRFASDVSGLEWRIEDWSYKIYGQPYAPATLHQAWALRLLCPLQAWRPEVMEIITKQRECNNNKKKGMMCGNGKCTRGDKCKDDIDRAWEVEVSSELDLDRAEELRLLRNEAQRRQDVYDLFIKRHANKIRMAGRQKIEVSLKDYTPEAILALQEETTKYINDRGVVIETLPTSNVRISYYQNYEEHHLWRWLGLVDSPVGPVRHRPTVCVGSDDPGIFATSLRNEFSHIYLTLRHHFNKTSDEAMNIVRKLNKNSREHGFRGTPPSRAPGRRFDHGLEGLDLYDDA